MEKHITIDQLDADLKSVSYGVDYLEFVRTHQISEDCKGEKHHIYMRAICGDNKIVYKLSYFNHIKAHILLAKAGLQGHFWWVGKSLYALNMMMMNRLNKLTDIEKITLDEVYHWSELRKKANEEQWKNYTKEEYDNICASMRKGWTAEHRKKAGQQMHEYYINRTEAEAQLHSEHCREAQLTFWSNVSDEYMTEHKIKSNKWKEDPEKYNAWLSKQGHAKNTVWLHNETKNKRVKVEDIEYYKSIGYLVGKLPHKCSDKLLKSNKGKNKGRIKLMKPDGSGYKMVLPAELEYYISIGYYQKVA